MNMQDLIRFLKKYAGLPLEITTSDGKVAEIHPYNHTIWMASVLFETVSGTVIVDTKEIVTIFVGEDND